MACPVGETGAPPDIVELRANLALDPRCFGLKAQGLRRAFEARANVPVGYALSERAATRWGSGDRAARNEVSAILTRIEQQRGDGGHRLAVRSSPSVSLPGALSSKLGVRSCVDEVCEAVARVLASREAASVCAQLDQRPRSELEELKLGVIVQAHVEVTGVRDAGGVVVSHDPASGALALSGELAPGQGAEAVVGGMGVPRGLSSLAKSDPEAHQRITKAVSALTAHFAGPIEVEFVYACGVVWVVQVRDQTLWPEGDVALALAAIEQDHPSYRARLRRVAERVRRGLVESHFAPPGGVQPLARGLAAAPGAASGALVIDLEEAVVRGRTEPVVLVRRSASAGDLPAAQLARALVTVEGGITSHAAVIARGLGLPAVVGCQELIIDAGKGEVRTQGGEVLLRRGDQVSVDGRRGLVYRGCLAVQPKVLSDSVVRLLAEAQRLRRFPVWVEGDAGTALDLKRQASLDGLVCRADLHEPLPATVGRDCWAEVSVAHAGRIGPSLPPGWGLLLSGEWGAEELDGIRRACPLRALGLRGTAQVLQSAADLAWDLWVVDDAWGGSPVEGAPRIVLAGGGDPSAHHARLCGLFEALEQALCVS